MRVYRPRSNWMDEERLSIPSIGVFETGGEWQDSGLLDASGAPLMYRNEIGPIGFVTDFTKAPEKPSRNKRK